MQQYYSNDFEEDPSRMMWRNSTIQDNKKNNIYEFNFPPLSSNTYSLINISGKQGDRIFSFETYNENGNLIYRKKLHQNDLRSNCMFG